MRYIKWSLVPASLIVILVMLNSNESYSTKIETKDTDLSLKPDSPPEESQPAKPKKRPIRIASYKLGDPIPTAPTHTVEPTVRHPEDAGVNWRQLLEWIDLEVPENEDSDDTTMEKVLYAHFMLTEQVDQVWSDKIEHELVDLVDAFEASDLNQKMVDIIHDAYNEIPQEGIAFLEKNFPGLKMTEVDVSAKTLQCRYKTCRLELDFDLGESKISKIMTQFITPRVVARAIKSYRPEAKFKAYMAPSDHGVVYLMAEDQGPWGRD